MWNRHLKGYKLMWKRHESMEGKKQTKIETHVEKEKCQKDWSRYGKKYICKQADQDKNVHAKGDM